MTLIMLTCDTFRVSQMVMTFSQIINLWGVSELAGDLGLPAKNVRRWLDTGSIPSDWFLAVEAAALKRGHAGVSLTTLAEAAEARRLSRTAEAA